MNNQPYSQQGYPQNNYYNNQNYNPINFNLYFEKVKKVAYFDIWLFFIGLVGTIVFAVLWPNQNAYRNNLESSYYSYYYYYPSYYYEYAYGTSYQELLNNANSLLTKYIVLFIFFIVIWVLGGVITSIVLLIKTQPLKNVNQEFKNLNLLSGIGIIIPFLNTYVSVKILMIGKKIKRSQNQYYYNN